MNQETQWLLQEKYQGVETPAFFADCDRLKAGEPLAYIIGSIPFLDCTIYLDNHPLIPRPETEYWVEHAISTIKTSSLEQPKILDLCAGSGCIGVAVAKALPVTHVDFAELDPNLLPTIAKNLQHNVPNFEHRTAVIQSDLFNAVTGTYDFILTNPPYIDPALDRTEPSVKSHEPHRALYGGDAGLELITTIIAHASEHLTTSGELWIEHEPEQSHTIRTLAEIQNFTCDTLPDQYKIDRYSRLTRH